MGLFSGKLKDVSTLNPEQQRLQKLLGGQFADTVEQGAQGSTFQGPLTAPLGANEQSNINYFSRLDALSQDSLSSLINLDDKKFDERFRSEVVDPTFRDFKENVLPSIQESLPSFSTAIGNVTAREAGNVNDQLLKTRFQAREAHRDRALQAIGAAQNQVRTAAGVFAIPREIQQAGLDKELTNFYKGQEQFAASLNTMLGFLGLQTKVFDRQPSGLDKINTVLTTLDSATSLAANFTPAGQVAKAAGSVAGSVAGSTADK